ncbi:MAG: MAPEG family protein [Proteobacteria bacterium]|nr:MAPEG family protein [Pseudomonadota bacterium]
MEAVAIVTIVSLMQFLFFGMRAGGVRGRTGLKAPAMTGNEEFERVNRVHQNTLEQLVVFVPALWIYAHYVNPLWGAGIGSIYIIGRFIYSAAYTKEPSTRALGFTISYLPSAVMLVWSLIVVGMSYL